MSVDEEKLKSFLVHYSSVRKFALSLCRNQSLADDLTQDTYLKVQRYAHTFQEGTNTKAWLFSIVKNLFISMKRHSYGRNVQMDDVLQNVLSYASGANQLSQAEANLELQDLSNSLERLPPDQKQAILLVCVEGFSYEDAAAICSTEVGTIKSRVNRARQNLQLILHGPLLESSSDKAVVDTESSADILEQLRKLQGNNEGEVSCEDIPTFLESY